MRQFTASLGHAIHMHPAPPLSRAHTLTHLMTAVTGHSPTGHAVRGGGLEPPRATENTPESIRIFTQKMTRSE